MSCVSNNMSLEFGMIAANRPLPALVKANLYWSGKEVRCIDTHMVQTVNCPSLEQSALDSTMRKASEKQGLSYLGYGETLVSVVKTGDNTYAPFTYKKGNETAKIKEFYSSLEEAKVEALTIAAGKMNRQFFNNFVVCQRACQS